MNETIIVKTLEDMFEVLSRKWEVDDKVTITLRSGRIVTFKVIDILHTN